MTREFIVIQSQCIIEKNHKQLQRTHAVDMQTKVSFMSVFQKLTHLVNVYPLLVAKHLPARSDDLSIPKVRR